MPGYLVDEGGERTHAVLPVDEYERLKKAAERLESVRGYAMEMISAMSGEEEAGKSEKVSEVSENPVSEQGNAEEDEQDRAWYQRT